MERSLSTRQDVEKFAKEMEQDNHFIWPSNLVWTVLLSAEQYEKFFNSIKRLRFKNMKNMKWPKNSLEVINYDRAKYNRFSGQFNYTAQTGMIFVIWKQRFNKQTIK